MTFLTTARSIQASAPIELYKFTRGATVYRVSSSAENVIHEGHTYYAGRYVQRGAIEQSEDIFKNVVNFDFTRSDSFASYYIQRASVMITNVEVIKMESSDSTYIPFWKGRVAGVKTNGNKITMEAEPIFTAQKRPGLRKVYELACNNTLYDQDCKASAAAFESFVTVTNVTGNVVTVSGLGAVADHYFTGGMVVDLYLNRYYISKQIGSELTTFFPPELEVNQNISIFPGCDHSYATCGTKFSNSLNFGGFPWMPGKNPFVGSLV